MKKTMLAIALLFSHQVTIHALGTIDIAIAAVIVGASLWSNNDQESVLEMDIALHPQEKDIYKAVNMERYDVTTILFTSLSISGLIWCGVKQQSIIPALPGLAVTGLSATAKYLKRIEIEKIAESVRNNNQTK